MKNRRTKANITSLNENEVFVFSSNAKGHHVGGAVMGIARGLSGKIGENGLKANTWYEVDSIGNFKEVL